MNASIYISFRFVANDKKSAMPFHDIKQHYAALKVIMYNTKVCTGDYRTLYIIIILNQSARQGHPCDSLNFETVL